MMKETAEESQSFLLQMELFTESGHLTLSLLLEDMEEPIKHVHQLILVLEMEEV